MLAIDDLDVGMHVTVVSNDPMEVTRGGVLMGGPVVVTTETDNSSCGAVLKIIALNLPYIAVRRISDLLGSKPWAYKIDTRRTRLIRVSDAYRKALVKNGDD